MLLLLTVWGQYDVIIVSSVLTVWCYYCPQCEGQYGVIIVNSVGTVWCYYCQQCWGQCVVIVNSVGTVWCYYCHQCRDSMMLSLSTVWGQYGVIIVNSVGDSVSLLSTVCETVCCYNVNSMWTVCRNIVNSVGTVYS